MTALPQKPCLTSAVLALLAFTSIDAQALTINGIFSGNVSSAEQTAFNYAAAQFENQFSNNMTVYIDVQGVSGVSYLGAAADNLSLFNTSSYNQIAAAITANDSQATLPSSISFSSTNYIAVPTAEAAALKLTSGPVTAGTFTFNTGYQFTTDPNNQAVSGAYDFIGVAEHEIAHLLGRIPGMDSTLSNNATYLTPLDFFRYTDVLGQPVFSPTSVNNAFFSLDGGVTNLVDFSSSSDYSDWSNGSSTDPFNAYTASGVNTGTMTAVDIQEMQALGYSLIALPIPSAIWLFISSCLGISVINQRRKTI